MKRLVMLLLTLVAIGLNSAYAFPPATPQITVERQGLFVTVEWNDDDNATGYWLFYAPYKDITNIIEDDFLNDISVIDLGKENRISFTLENGDGYYAWVVAYNADDYSEVSNIEHVVIDNKIIAFFSDRPGGKLFRQGVEEAFENVQGARLESVTIDLNDREQLRDMFFGTTGTETQKAYPGYINDPNVLAVITATTANALDLTSQIVENSPLVIACSATSTILDVKSNVLRLPARNDTQAQMVYNHIAATQNQLKYAVVLSNRPSHTLYAYDLYAQLLNVIFPVETGLLKTKGLTEAGAAAPFAQFVGGLMFDGTDAQVETIAKQLDILGANVVFYIGIRDYLKKFSVKRPNIKWIGSDGDYDYANFKDSNNVTVVTLGGNTQDYGYDAGSFLKAVLDPLSASFITRSRILKQANNTAYEGRTGKKAFVGNTGWYDMWKPGADDWEKISD